MEIRDAKLEDAESISALINRVAHFFTLDPKGKGAERFLESISPEAIRSYVSSDDYDYIVALGSNNIVGVAAMKDGTHLFHLFVAPEYQKKGLSILLWNTIQNITKSGKKEFTVNSTPYAVPVYEKFGFVASGTRTEKNGVAFVPMKKTG